MSGHNDIDRLKRLRHLASFVAEQYEERKEEEKSENKLRELSPPIVKSNLFETPAISYDLPYGARMTGAKKLHVAGMTGDGIKVGI
eukprot:CAMPEP_0194238098 /NCGR_PEP_ID=MMETSP0158-20130606/4931_1 /TAXON_ID=33649 /ORGANISM="Thalassionema nitzschioides, Strain L26-B" /LENGTH=85 /DNA_ID=CAMNT_0038972275 /DNA_START=28 /DNA_END=282 /DNA_ORIENTATION=+